MPNVAGISAGSWNPSYDSNGVTAASAYGAARNYRDGIFVRSVFLKELAIKQRMNAAVFAKVAGTAIDVSSKKGRRFTLPTKSIPAVGDVSQNFTTGSYSYPDYLATDSITAGGDSFTRTIGAGTSVLGIPVPIQRINEGEVELVLSEYRGLGMVFTKEYLELSLLENPSQYYAEMIKYAMVNDMERYMWLACLYTGPLTETADDYGSISNDSIGITNRASYALTRTLSSVGTGSNLITATVDTNAAGMSNPNNSRFGTSPSNVPWLFGNTASDISYSTISRMSQRFNSVNVPAGKRHIIAESKGAQDIMTLPQFVNRDLNGDPNGTNINKTGKVEGTIFGFDLHMSNVIQPTGASSNILYEVAIADEALAYGIQADPGSLIIDDMLNKKEMAIFVGDRSRYGAVVQRPDHVGIIQTRIAS